MIERHFTRTFEVGARTRLALDHGDGDVTISSWEKDTLEVEVDYRAEVVSGPEGDFQLDADQKPDEVRIVGRFQRAGSAPFALRELQNRVTVHAPRALPLELHGEDGNIRIQGWRGPVAIKTKDGSIDLEDVQCPSVTVRMSDGALRISGARVPQIDIAADDGNLELELLRQDDLACRIRSKDGRVRVALEAGSSVSFSISTDEGGVRVDHPEAADVSRGPRGVSGRIGGGAGRLEVTTDDGPVVLEGLGG